MTKQNFQADFIGLRSNTKREFNRMLKNDKPNLIINLLGIKFDISVDDGVYSDDEFSKLTNIIDGLSKSIWIDRTYVQFRGNRFKDAFIKEDGWYQLNKRLTMECLGKGDGTEDETAEALLTLAMCYLYDMLSKYGYDTETISLEFGKNMKFESMIYIDNRTSWRF